MAGLASASFSDSSTISSSFRLRLTRCEMSVAGLELLPAEADDEAVPEEVGFDSDTADIICFMV